MGNCLKNFCPKKIVYDPIEPTISPPYTNKINVEIENVDDIYTNCIFDRLKLIIEVPEDLDVLIERTGDYIPEIQYLDELMDEFYISDEFSSLTRSYSYAEIDNYLSRIENPLYPVILSKPDDILLTNASNIEYALKLNLHIQWSNSVENFLMLKTLLERATRLNIIDKYIDLVDSRKKISAVSEALVNLNPEALIFLVKKCMADIPVYVDVKEKTCLFLIYLAERKEFRYNDENSVLYLIMKEIVFRAEGNKEYLDKYFCSLCPTRKITILHLFIDLYLDDNSPSNVLMFRCIDLCICQLPNALMINGKCNDISMDVICRIITMANLKNISLVTNIINHIRHVFSYHFQQYTKFIRVHSNVEIYSTLLQLFE